MFTKSGWLFGCLCAAILTGCSRAPTHQIPPPLTVADITQWETVGRVGIRTQDDALSGNFSWRQGDNLLDLSIIGPFGQGATSLRQTQTGEIELKYDNITVQGPSADQLLLHHFGWQFPVSQVAYWIRGLPAPSSSATVLPRFDSPLPQSIQQDGWIVEYKQFSDVRGLQLPSKLEASNPPYRVNLIINQWTIQ
jgi:outer membrane lipoprotein LolB